MPLIQGNAIEKINMGMSGHVTQRRGYMHHIVAVTSLEKKDIDPLAVKESNDQGNFSEVIKLFQPHEF